MCVCVRALTRVCVRIQSLNNVPTNYTLHAEYYELKMSCTIFSLTIYNFETNL